MREIKFRGLVSSENRKYECVFNTWIYGSLHHFYDDFFIYYNGEWIRVYTDSVGEYTGIKDKNGTEIYEGDILQRNDNSITVVEFDNGMFTTAYDSLKFELYDNGSVVIGNIYQNPELSE